MDDTLVCFRCSPEVIKCLDSLQNGSQVSRSAIIAKAINQLNKEVLHRQGKLIPPYPKDLARPPYQGGK